MITEGVGVSKQLRENGRRDGRLLAESVGCSTRVRQIPIDRIPDRCAAHSDPDPFEHESSAWAEDRGLGEGIRARYRLRPDVLSWPPNRNGYAQPPALALKHARRV